MFYKALILDLDNTLYDYDYCNKSAINSMFYYIKNKYNYDLSYISYTYINISKTLKYELNNTASCHNRNIYIKQLCETLKITYNEVYNINKIYWDTFYLNIKPYDSVIDFIKFNKQNNIKIGILTDFELEYQILKLKYLNILEYIDTIVSSEEVGIEKPSKQMFLTILDKLNTNKSDTIMIGDNYEKDIMGAKNINIFSFYFNKNFEFKKYNNYIAFNNFNILLNKFQEIYNELNLFVLFSNKMGERFDLVQAGGGNTSFKIDHLLFIKSSGVSLNNISVNSGYSIIRNDDLYNDISNNINNDIDKYNYIINPKPSIETYMHCLLFKYTIHLHPLVINKILVLKNAKNIIEKLFPESLIIDYITPGFKLSNKIYKCNKKYNIIFLLNHGIIISNNNYDYINTTLEYIIDVCKNYLINNNIYCDLFDYNIINTLSSLIKKFTTEKITIKKTDNIIIKKYIESNINIFKSGITFPDTLIYCGVNCLFLNELKDVEISNYKNLYNMLPKVIIYNKNLFIISNTLNKCNEIEDVLIANLYILDNKKLEINYLCKEEINFLNNWDSEKYRQSINN